MVRESSWNRLLGPLICLALVLFFFGSVLFRDNQLSFRDAGHYYYPLYQLVQREWNAGRWPLWEPEENSGMPLLGNPTAAVLYPGKVVYGIFPYPLAAKLYIVGHTVIAFATMTLALRSWGLSRASCAVGSLSYAFGAPILFQYCNIIFLVGAAWLPLGFRAVDRWVRLGNRWGLLELALVLALQTLGGDPQVAYLLGLAAAVYAIQLSWFGSHPASDREVSKVASGKKSSPRSRAYVGWLIAFVGLAVWVVVTLFLARLLPQLRPSGRPAPALPWMRWAPHVVAVGWLGLVTLWWIRSRDRDRRRLLVTMLLGLIASAALGGGLTAAQLLPVAEFTGMTSRAAEGGPHDIYPFSLDPMMLAQFVWPNLFGTHFPNNTFWIEPFELPSFRRTIWVPSLYIGGIGLILAISAFGFRGGPPWRAWLSGVILFSILGSFGQFTSPIWLVRAFDLELNPALRESKRIGNSRGADTLLGIGPIDPQDVNPVRLDGYLRDGDGGFYWALSTFLPGFRQFRYPSKMLTFACFGLSALAGLGWDRLLRGDGRRAVSLSVGLFAVTLLAIAAALPMQGALLKLYEARTGGSQWGPFESLRAYRGLVASLVHTAILLSLGLATFRLAGRRPTLAGALVAILVASDLAVANGRLILSAPQALFEGVPKTLQIIRDAEAKDPSNAPYRIHRMPIWNPPAWHTTRSETRASDYTSWERETIQPKYGITENVEYTQTIGVTEIYDYEWFFGPFPRKAKPGIAGILGVELDTPIVYYPRRAYDMWNTRYFILPQYPGHWTDAARGYASFIGNVERIYPPVDAFTGPQGNARLLDWTENHDYQIFRNEAQYPRAWAVHSFRSIKGISGLNRDNRETPMQEILYADDPIWSDPDRKVFDPREIAWIEEDQIEELRPFLGSKSRGNAETVKVRYPSPQRAEIDCTLSTPGMVVLADVYYPGWKLTIDGKPAPIYRANRLMRGAAVPAGTHKLIYTFEPDSFRIGLMISAAAMLAAACLAAFSWRRPISSTISAMTRA